MSDRGGYPDEMGNAFDPSDEDIERLLSGLAPAGDTFDDVAALVEHVQLAYAAAPDRSLEDRHVRRIVEAAHLLGTSHGTEPRRIRRTGVLPFWRRRVAVIASLFSTLSAKVAGAALAATVATGGLAATGTLPDPAQTAVANVVEHVGITIPDPAEKAEEKIARIEDKVEEKIARIEDKAADKAAKAEDEAARGEDETDGDVAGNSQGKSVADDVHDALEGEYETGREKGKAVSEAASQNRQNDDKGGVPALGGDEDEQDDDEGDDQGDENDDETLDETPNRNPARNPARN